MFALRNGASANLDGAIPLSGLQCGDFFCQRGTSRLLFLFRWEIRKRVRCKRMYRMQIWHVPTGNWADILQYLPSQPIFELFGALL